MSEFIDECGSSSTSAENDFIPLPSIGKHLNVQYSSVNCQDDSEFATESLDNTFSDSEPKYPFAIPSITTTATSLSLN